MKTTVRKPLASLAAACLVAALSSLTLTPAYAEPADDSEPVADLYASQVIDDHLSYVVPGEEVTFELEVVNLSKDVPSEDVVLTYELDPSFTGTTVETSGDAGLSCSVDTKADGNVVTCTSDSIGPGQQGFVKVTTRALEEPKDRYYFNEGGLTSATKNAHDGDYLTYAQLGEFVTWDADVRISAEAVGEVVPGESGEWTITVTNAGPETAKSLLVDSLVFQSKITDQGPSAWGYFPELSSEAPNVVCDLACDVEDLAPGESIILTTTVDLSGLDGDEVEATFSVFPFGGDLNPDNNQVTLRYEKTSSEPEQPAEPEEPVEPEQPAEPEEPVEPEQPAEPEEPVEPEQPAEPGAPEDPAPELPGKPPLKPPSGPAEDPSEPPASSPPAHEPTLPKTGADTAALALFAAGLMAAGALGLKYRRIGDR